MFTHAAPATGDGQDVFEAESASLFGGVITASNQSGYSGSGFADYPAATGANVKVQWQIERAGAGDADIDVRYANGSGASRSLELVVNGNTVQTVAFGPTGAWPNWQTMTLEDVALATGSNTVALIARSSIGPNIDRLSLPSEGSASSLGAATAPQVVNRVIHWPVASINDGDTVSGRTYDKLWGARYVATTRIGSNTYALVTASWDDGVQIIDITDPARPAPVSSFDDGDTVSGKTFDMLSGTDEIVTTKIGSNTYALVVGWADDGVQIVDVTDPANPVPVASFDDGDTVGGKTYDELDGATGITIAKIGSGTYALVAASDDDGVQIVDITDPANPVPVASFDDGDTVGGKTYDELEGPASITTARIGASTYALVAASDDDGVQIVDITDPASPLPVASFDDGDTVGSGTYDELDDPRYIITVGIGSRTYALVASFADHGVQIIDITDPASPVPAASFDEGDTAGGKTYRELRGAGSITTARIGSRTYAVVAAHDDNGVQIVDITDPASPVPVASFEDGDTVGSRTYENLDGPANIGTVRIGSGTYVLVTAYFDNGVQIIGLKGPLTVDAGRDQAVREGETVTLSGTVSDPEDERLTYEWTHDSSLAISLADDAALSTSFTAPAVTADTTVTFTLAVSDGDTSASDTVAVTISKNRPPAVDAGQDQAVDKRATVTLSGTVSDPDNDPLAYQWTHDSSLEIGLANATALTTTFVAPAVTTDTAVTFTLAVSDGIAAASDTVSVTIEAGPVPTLASLTLSGVDIGQFHSGTTAYAGVVASTVTTTTVTATPTDSGNEVTIADPDGRTVGTSRTVSLAEGTAEITVMVVGTDDEATGTYTVTVTRVAGSWGERRPEEDIALDAISRPTGIWGSTETLWIAAWGEYDIYAYDFAGNRVSDRDLTLTSGGYPKDMWSDGTTLWVADHFGGVQAHSLADGSRVPDEDFGNATSTAGNDTPNGLWSDETTMRVADRVDGKVYAYALSDKARQTGAEFSLGGVETFKPFGLWSDGETVFSASWHGGKVHAFRLADGRVLPAMGIDTGASGNTRPFGVWSVGETMWVVDDAAQKAFAYAVPGPGGGGGEDEAAEVVEVSIASDGSPVSEGTAAAFTLTRTGDTTDALTVAVSVSESGAMVVDAPTGATFGAGESTAALAVATTDDAVVEASSTVTAALTQGTGYAVASDGGSAEVVVEDDDAATIPASIDAKLKALTLSGLDIGTFDAATTEYAAAAAESVAETTVTATPNDAAATVRIADANGSTSGTTRDVALGYGANTITVEVTAADGETTKTYTVTVTRAYTLPTATLIASTSPVTEGADASFTVRLDKRANDALTVAVTVAETGQMLSGTVSSVAIAVGDTAATLNLDTADDSVVEDASKVTVALGAGDGYTVGTTDSAEVSVTDDDAAIFAVAAAPSGIDEGDATTVTVSITNGVTFAADQAVTLTASGTAAADDYTLSATTLTLAAGDGAVSATLTATDDEFEEPAETVTVSAAHGDSTIGSATVTIAASDAALSDDATLSALTLSGIDIGTFDPATMDYTAEVGHDVDATTVTATLNDTDASVTISDADGSTSGTTRGAALDYGSNRITATVTAADGETTATYTATVSRPRPPLTASVHDVPARHDGVGDVEFELRFSEEIALSYRTLRAGYEVQGGTLRWTRRMAPPSNVRWRIVVEPAGDGEVAALLPGNQMCGAARAVCAADGRMLSNSPLARIPGPLTVPVVSIVADGTPVSEGRAAAFTLTRTGDATDALTVAVSVAESGAMAAADAPTAASFGDGDSTATLSVATTDDAVVEASSTVTAALAAGTGYTVAAEGGSAEVVVEDDDAATFAVAASPAEIEEGDAATVTVSITNDVTFAADQTVTLTASGTAAEEDYTLSATSLTLAAGGAAVSATLTATDDKAEEAAETVTLTASHGDTEIGTATVTIAANDAPSDDATLAALTLSGIDIGLFEASTTAYAADVDNDVDSTTMTAAPSDADAQVTISDADGSTAGTTRTTRLAEGPNVVRAAVTAADGETTATYTVTVTRAAAQTATWGERLPGKDIDLSAADRPRGLGSDGETLWAADWDTAGVVAYALADGTRREARDFGLGSFLVTALYTDGETLWAADYEGGVYAYRLSDGERLEASDLDEEAMAEAGNGRPAGLWSDGETMWVADHDDGKAYAYRLSDAARLAELEFSLRPDDATAHLRPLGLWSDGDTVLSTDWSGGTVRGYALAGGARQNGNDIGAEATANDYAAGLWSDGETLWVVDEYAQKAYAYAAPELQKPAAQSEGLVSGLSSRALVVPGGTAAGPPVSIPDPALRGRIAAALGKAAADAVGVHELGALVVLDARDAGVTDLTGLEHAVNLEGLDLGHNPLADLRPLWSLTALRRLNLDGTRVDLWDLATLRGLTELSLRSNGLADVWALSSMNGLEVLDLGGNRIGDLAAVAALADLRVLGVSGNRVAELWPLAGLERLSELHVGGNLIEDFAPLAERAGLRVFGAGDQLVNRPPRSTGAARPPRRRPGGRRVRAACARRAPRSRPRLARAGPGRRSGQRLEPECRQPADRL